tara:strand:- start:323 stop:835 length:513 start_codon:yes stop_codon:yes gene_type:complete
MNKLNIVGLLVGFLYPLWVVPSAFSATLTLQIQGHENKSGQLNIAISKVKGLLTDEVQWHDLESLRKLTQEIGPEHDQQSTVQLIIEDLPIGLTCIRLYLDLNNNQLLERSTIGLPLEPVGFSNNPSLFKGEPTPQDSCFMLQQTDNVQKIKLKQHKKRKRKSKLGAVIN